MAAGTHWEYRVFGDLGAFVRMAVAGLPKKFGIGDLGMRHVDHYLWTSASDVNVKLRDDTLKFKRRLQAFDDGFELWTEHPDEAFSFPLAREAIEFMQTHMQTTAPTELGDAPTYAAFEAALPSFDPPVRVVSVDKRRINYALEEGGHPLLLEVAEILAPTSTWSLALESADLGPNPAAAARASVLATMRAIVEARLLPLAAAVYPAGYLQEIARWLDES
jgi:hypothetical protein